MVDTEEQTQPETQTAAERWIALVANKGFTSERELERTAGLTQGTISAWTTTKSYKRDPTVASYRVLKGLLGVSLDLLDELIMGMRDGKIQAAAK